MGAAKPDYPSTVSYVQRGLGQRARKRQQCVVGSSGRAGLPDSGWIIAHTFAEIAIMTVYVHEGDEDI